MTEYTDTIAAIATPVGTGGIGVVRISGSAVVAIAQALLGKAPAPRHAHYAQFRDRNGVTLDRGLALYFPAPHSFTGEHVLELHAHGSPVVLHLLLQRLFELGARPARAGEFSERAFLNGKLDLVQAEAIADLIASQSELAARAALRSLSGEFSRHVQNLLAALVRLRVYIEATIDFPEEEVDLLSTPQLRQDLFALNKQSQHLLAQTRRGVVLRDGLHVVIVGRPNAGKSSLLNALAETDRAIVTPVAGTTRDLLREAITLDGIAFTLVDTAGLHQSSDLIEQESMRRARSELARADVLLLVTDSAHAEVDRSLLRTGTTNALRIFVHNKIDLSAEPARCEQSEYETHIWLSVDTGIGLELLRAELKRMAGHGDATVGSFSARTRHVAALEQVQIHLQSAIHALLELRAGELAAEELHAAQRALASITGEFGSEDLLAAIFSSFCIGK